MIVFSIGGITVYLALTLIIEIMKLSEYFTMFNNALISASLVAGIVGGVWCVKEIIEELTRKKKVKLNE